MTGELEPRDPRDLIDRSTEQDLFTQILPEAGKDNASSARVLTIRAKGGAGKSALLERLLYNCRYVVSPRAVGCLIDLDQVKDPSPFSFILAFYDGLREIPGVNVKELFVNFRRFNEARKRWDYAIFGPQDEAWSAGAGIVGSAQAGVLGPGARSSGINIEQISHIDTSYMLQSQRQQFTDEQERWAREKCVAAFFDDLRIVCESQTIVILLDTWERCNLTLREWLLDVFLGIHCLGPDVSLRPARLSIVIAGQPYHYTDRPYGLRENELEHLFRSPDEFKVMVKVPKSLSELERDHIRQFIMLNNGGEEPSDAVLNVLEEQMVKGCTLSGALFIVKALYPEASPR
jgi:hypothetical protein